MNKRMRDLIQFLRDKGFRTTLVANGSRHVRVHLTSSDGYPVQISVSASPSEKNEKRWHCKCLVDAKRALLVAKARGLQKTIDTRNT